MSDGWPDELIVRAEKLDAEAARLRRAADEARDSAALYAALEPIAEMRSWSEVFYGAKRVEQIAVAGLGELEDWESVLLVERLLGESYGSSGDLWTLWRSERDE
ncbi:hypothetical protein AXK56_11700 [Tsukamurella pulmonis]|uniref:Uncharacterized protein n=1 Tax=Tsukamurella pulmonis TaxID=47312 RepID=A0A1H1H4Q2_9ACTN|nr:hypothetical protein [Tsukamurella pulmonis]KXO88043.1 hypothetical protein AXK56_11700 [Tsukamurella pulmonis]SDR20472.1 hypothetical protein SAMN04489765_3818 [Tsukamurella pulmonis]SUP15947.1 Uncharacterised protein [Tsukamurella pulmonis]